MTVQYIHLPYEAYKSLEAQMRAFAETVHQSTGGFYHKSIRLRIDDNLIMEFHGPLVGGYGHDVGQRDQQVIPIPTVYGPQAQEDQETQLYLFPSKPDAQPEAEPDVETAHCPDGESKRTIW